MQMLSIALPAMAAGVADPERLRPAHIKTGRARFAYARGMPVQAPPALPFSSGCTKASSSPVEESLRQVARMSSSHLRFHSRLPRAARRRLNATPSPPSTLTRIASATLSVNSRRHGSLSVMHLKAK